MSEDKNFCIEQVSPPGGFHLYRCDNPAKYGKYCGVHSPEKKAEKRARRGPSKWDRERAARKRYDDALDAVLVAARVAANTTTFDGERLAEALEAFDAMTMGGNLRRPIF